MKHGEMDAPLPHPSECGAHKVPRVAPLPVGSVYRHIHDASLDTGYSSTKTSSGKTAAVTWISPPSSTMSDLFGSEGRVLLQIVVLLPTLHAPIQSAGGQQRHRSPVLPVSRSTKPLP